MKKRLLERMGDLCVMGWHYLGSQLTKLALYVTDGTYPIDNNACENSIRPFCIGRRNWLFSDTVASVFTAADLRGPRNRWLRLPARIAHGAVWRANGRRLRSVTALAYHIAQPLSGGRTTLLSHFNHTSTDGASDAVN